MAALHRPQLRSRPARAGGDHVIVWILNTVLVVSGIISIFRGIKVVRTVLIIVSLLVGAGRGEPAHLISQMNQTPIQNRPETTVGRFFPRTPGLLGWIRVVVAEQEFMEVPIALHSKPQLFGVVAAVAPGIQLALPVG